VGANGLRAEFNFILVRMNFVRGGDCGSFKYAFSLVWITLGFVCFPLDRQSSVIDELVIVL